MKDIKDETKFLQAIVRTLTSLSYDSNTSVDIGGT